MLGKLFLVTFVAAIAATLAGPVITSSDDANRLVNEVSAAGGQQQLIKNNKSLATATHNGCASPEVLVNGAPSPEIVNTVGGGTGGAGFANIEEIQFVGVVGPSEQKRVCKIKCLNGVWVGPLCALEHGSDRFETPVFRECQLRQRIDSGLVLSQNESQLVLDRSRTLADGSLIKVRCEEVGLYKFLGSPVIQCKNGHWNFPMPRCEATTLQTNFSLDSPPSIVYSVSSGDAGVNDVGEVVLFPGSIAHFDCLFPRQSGDPEWSWSMALRQYPSGWAVNTEERSWKYRLSIYYANDQDSGEFKCITPKGRVNSIKVVVRDIECPPIDSLDPNRVMSVEGNKMHNRARFSCIEGFSLDGSDDIVCTPNGYWSYPPPKCKAIECPDVQSDDPHMVIAVQNRTFGSRAYFSCPDAYKLSGPSFMTCLKNNSWSDDLPSCEAIDCQPPLPPVNGRVLDSGRFRTGDYVQFLCNTGYILVGESLSVCLENGTWSKPVPNCKPSCDFPGEPPNGYVLPTKFHYNIGESISIVCKPNYRLIGSALAYCNPDGQWSVALPNCRTIFSSNNV